MAMTICFSLTHPLARVKDQTRLCGSEWHPCRTRHISCISLDLHPSVKSILKIPKLLSSFPSFCNQMSWNRNLSLLPYFFFSMPLTLKIQSLYRSNSFSGSRVSVVLSSFLPLIRCFAMRKIANLYWNICARHCAKCLLTHFVPKRVWNWCNHSPVYRWANKVQRGLATGPK